MWHGMEQHGMAWHSTAGLAALDAILQSAENGKPQGAALTASGLVQFVRAGT